MQKDDSKQSPISLVGRSLLDELKQHLDVRYEILDLRTTIGERGTIYIEQAMLKPRDEL